VVPATSRVLNDSGQLAEKLALDVVLVPAVFDSSIDPDAGDLGSGCGCSTPGDGGLPLGLLGVACALWIGRRRRRS